MTDTTDDRLDAVLKSIDAGYGDGDIETVLNTVLARRKYLDELEYAKLKVGDRVVFNDRGRPKYLIGVQGVITARRKGKFDITVDEEEDTGRFGSLITAPGALLTKVDA